MSPKTAEMYPRSLPEDVSKESPRQAKCLQGASQAAKMSPRSLTDQQSVSQEPPRQPKCIPGACQTSKMRPRILPDNQNVSQKPPRQPKCFPGASQSGKMNARSIPDSQNVFPGASQTCKINSPKWNRNSPELSKHACKELRQHGRFISSFLDNELSNTTSNIDQGCQS